MVELVPGFLAQSEFLLPTLIDQLLTLTTTLLLQIQPKIDKVIEFKEKLDRQIRAKIGFAGVPNRGVVVHFVQTLTFLLTLIPLAYLCEHPVGGEANTFNLFVKLGGDGREIGGIAQFMFCMILMKLRGLACNSPYNVVPLLMAEGNPMSKEESKKHGGKTRFDPEKHTCLKQTLSKSTNARDGTHAHRNTNSLHTLMQIDQHPLPISCKPLSQRAGGLPWARWSSS